MSSFRTYFDLDDDERAALTSDQVRDFCKAQMMVDGVEPIQQREPPKVAAIDVPTKTMHVVQWSVESRYGRTTFSGEIAFEDRADAEAFAKMRVCQSETNYELPDKIKAARPLSGASITTEDLVESTVLTRLMTELKQVKVATDEYEKWRRQVAKNQEAANKATSGIWEDWNQQQSRVAGEQRVREVFEEYLTMTKGDESVARGFLAKTYGEELVEKSIGVRGRSIQTPAVQ